MLRRLYMIWLCLFAPILTGCNQFGLGARIECADIHNDFESGFPFDWDSAASRTQWIATNYGISKSEIRESGPWLYWSKGQTQYAFTTDGPRVIKSWARDPGVRDVIRCLGDPETYQAFKETDRYVLILWYPKRATSFEASYRQYGKLAESPFGLDSGIWTSQVVRPGDLASMLEDANPNPDWVHLRDVAMARPWPGDIKTISIVEVPAGNK